MFKRMVAPPRSTSNQIPWTPSTKIPMTKDEIPLMFYNALNTTLMMIRFDPSQMVHTMRTSLGTTNNITTHSLPILHSRRTTSTNNHNLMDPDEQQTMTCGSETIGAIVCCSVMDQGIFIAFARIRSDFRATKRLMSRIQDECIRLLIKFKIRVRSVTMIYQGRCGRGGKLVSVQTQSGYSDRRDSTKPRGRVPGHSQRPRAPPRNPAPTNDLCKGSSIITISDAMCRCIYVVSGARLMRNLR